MLAAPVDEAVAIPKARQFGGEDRSVLENSSRHEFRRVGGQPEGDDAPGRVASDDGGTPDDLSQERREVRADTCPRVVARGPRRPAVAAQVDGEDVEAARQRGQHLLVALPDTHLGGDAGPGTSRRADPRRSAGGPGRAESRAPGTPLYKPSGLRPAPSFAVRACQRRNASRCTSP